MQNFCEFWGVPGAAYIQIQKEMSPESRENPVFFFFGISLIFSEWSLGGAPGVAKNTPNSLEIVCVAATVVGRGFKLHSGIQLEGGGVPIGKVFRKQWNSEARPQQGSLVRTTSMGLT